MSAMSIHEIELARGRARWYPFKMLTQGLLLIALAIALLSLAYALVAGSPLIYIDLCCEEVQCEEPVRTSMDESQGSTSTPDPFTPTPTPTSIQTQEPTVTPTGYVPDPSSTPTDIPGPTGTPEPSNTPTPAPEPTNKVACNRGLGNGAEDCDPGSSGGKPGKAGENEG